MIDVLNYQLNCNKKHDCLFYIKIKNSIAKIYIRKYIKNQYINCEPFVLPFHPISSGWIDNNIYLLSNDKFFLLDSLSFKMQELALPRYKIVDILSLPNNKEYIYSTIINPEFIDFYIKSNNNTDSKILSYNSNEDKLVQVNSVYLQIYKDLIFNYINEFKLLNKKNINDIFKGHILQIKRDNLYSNIIIDNHCIRNVFGCIDRAYIFGKKIVYSISSLVKSSQVYELKYDNKFKISYDRRCYSKYYIISHHKDYDAKIYYYKFKKIGENKGVICMIHGGPAAKYSNRFDIMAYSMAKLGYIVYLLNYPGSIGYGINYQKQLYENGGSLDCDAIKGFMDKLSKINKNNPLYIIGDSYGAYLGILTLLKSTLNITKVYALNAFTDIRHQYLFSISKSAIIKYFPKITSKNIRDINPIDLVSYNQLKNRLLIINGLNDLYCPKEQLIQFQNISGCDLNLVPNYPHFVLDYAIINKIIKIILKDMGECK